MAKRAKPIDYTLNKIISYLLQHEHTATAPKIEDQQPLEISHSDILDSHSNSHHTKYHSVRKLSTHSNKPSSLNIPSGLSIPSSLKASYGNNLSIYFPGTDMGILFVNKLYSRLQGRFHTDITAGNEGIYYINTESYSLDYLEIPNLNNSGFKTTDSAGVGNFYNNKIWFRSVGTGTYCSFDLYTHKFNSAVVGDVILPEETITPTLISENILDYGNSLGFCGLDNINTAALGIEDVPHINNYNKFMVNSIGKIYDINVAGTSWWDYGTSTWTESVDPYKFPGNNSYTLSITNIVRSGNNLEITSKIVMPSWGNYVYSFPTATFNPAYQIGLRVYDTSTNTWSNHTGLTTYTMYENGIDNINGNCAKASYTMNWGSSSITPGSPGWFTTTIVLNSLFDSTKSYILEIIVYKISPLQYNSSTFLQEVPAEKAVFQLAFSSEDF